MLDELVVQNAGLIGQAHIEPGPGMVVVTGETGTGKTLLLGALRLLVGESVRKEHIGPLGPELDVAGRFILNGEETTVRRRVSEHGRSRAYLDGEMVPARELHDRIAPAVDIVGQHDALRLATSDGLRAIVDGLLDAEGTAALEDYEAAYSTWADLTERQSMLGGDRKSLERELDMVRFQADEITEAGFQAGDDRRLATDADRLRNAAAIAETLRDAHRTAGDSGGATERLGEALAHLGLAARLDPAFASLTDQAVESSALLDELVGSIVRALDALEHEPATLDEVELRIAGLRALERKYGDSLAEVLEFGVRATTRSTELSSLLADAESIDTELAKATRRLDEAGDLLRIVRGETAERLSAIAVAHLVDLGFGDPVIEIAVVAASPSLSGADKITLQFASDVSLVPGPVGKIASGGELSRVVLALRLASGVADAAVVAFDEVDAGVGGVTALAMGLKLANLARGRQVLCVTHLPQVAAYAERHFVVRRSGTVADVTLVDGEARIEEIARMLAGLADSKKGREHAAELLAAARQDAESG